jgi:hypothetical protein
MSISSAKSNAQSARSASGTDQKLNYLAQAIRDLAKVVGDIEDDVAKIKRKTSA